MYSICPRSLIMLHMSRVGRTASRSASTAPGLLRPSGPCPPARPARPHELAAMSAQMRAPALRNAAGRFYPRIAGAFAWKPWRSPPLRPAQDPGAGPQGRALQSPFPAGADSHQLCASQIGRAQGTGAESPLPRRGPAAIRAYASPAHIHGQGHKFLTPFNAVRGCRRGLPSQF